MLMSMNYSMAYLTARLGLKVPHNFVQFVAGILSVSGRQRGRFGRPIEGRLRRSQTGQLVFGFDAPLELLPLGHISRVSHSFIVQHAPRLNQCGALVGVGGVVRPLIRRTVVDDARDEIQFFDLFRVDICIKSVAEKNIDPTNSPLSRADRQSPSACTPARSSSSVSAPGVHRSAAPVPIARRLPAIRQSSPGRAKCFGPAF